MLAFAGATGPASIPRFDAAIHAGWRSCSQPQRSEAYGAAEILLKGPEAFLPDGRFFKDKQGHIRHEARLRWWDRNATTLRKAALGMEGHEESLPDLPVTTEFHYREMVPTFFGHYWLRGVPLLSSDYGARLDFSVAKGFLTAYRWSGENILSPNNVVYVSALQS